MNAVGIDVSKGKSTVAVLRPFGEIVVSPFDVSHSPKELSKLVTLLKTLKQFTISHVTVRRLYLFQTVQLYLSQML